MIKNEHLEPIFKKVLPVLDEHRIEYRVYGGVGIAGAKGKFTRKNCDVDIIVMDWKKTKLILENLASDLQYEYCLKGKNKQDFKIELRQNKKELFAAVPAYSETDHYDFRYNRMFPLDFFEPVSRHLGEYSFVSLKDKYLKELLILYFENNLSKKGGRHWNKHMQDAKDFLTEEEIARINS
jgi:hypothetical protein